MVIFAEWVGKVLLDIGRSHHHNLCVWDNSGLPLQGQAGVLSVVALCSPFSHHAQLARHTK